MEYQITDTLSLALPMFSRDVLGLVESYIVPPKPPIRLTQCYAPTTPPGFSVMLLRLDECDPSDPVLDARFGVLFTVALQEQKQWAGQRLQRFYKFNHVVHGDVLEDLFVRVPQHRPRPFETVSFGYLREEKGSTHQTLTVTLTPMPEDCTLDFEFVQAYHHLSTNEAQRALEMHSDYKLMRLPFWFTIDSAHPLYLHPVRYHTLCLRFSSLHLHDEPLTVLGKFRTLAVDDIKALYTHLRSPRHILEECARGWYPCLPFHDYDDREFVLYWPTRRLLIGLVAADKETFLPLDRIRVTCNDQTLVDTCGDLILYTMARENNLPIHEYAYQIDFGQFRVFAHDAGGYRERFILKIEVTLTGKGTGAASNSHLMVYAEQIRTLRYGNGKFGCGPPVE